MDLGEDSETAVSMGDTSRESRMMAYALERLRLENGPIFNILLSQY